MRKIILLTLSTVFVLSNLSAQKEYALNPETATIKASDKVVVQRVTFRNQYQMEVVGNLFMPLCLKRLT